MTIALVAVYTESTWGVPVLTVLWFKPFAFQCWEKTFWNWLNSHPHSPGLLSSQFRRILSSRPISQLFWSWKIIWDFVGINLEAKYLPLKIQIWRRICTGSETERPSLVYSCYWNRNHCVHNSCTTDVKCSQFWKVGALRKWSQKAWVPVMAISYRWYYMEKELQPSGPS